MIFAPDFFGHPATNNFFSRIYYSDNPAIGIIGFLLVIFSFLAFFKNREVVFWIFFTLFPMLLMTETPLGNALRYLPISLFSLVTPMRMIWMVAFSLAVLAGLGLDTAYLLITKRKFWKFCLPIIFLWEIIFLIWIASLLIPEGEHIRIAQRNLILPTVFLTGGSVFLILSLFYPKLWPIFASLMVLLSGGELVRQGMKYNPFIAKELVFPKTEILEKIQTEGETWRTMITHPELLPVNSNIPYQIPMIDGYASIYDGRYGQLVKLANVALPISKIEGYPRIVFQTEYNSPIIDLLNIRWVLSLLELKNPKLRLIAEEGKTKLYENLEVGPKAFFAKQFYVEENNLAVAKRMLEIDLSKEVVLEEFPKLVEKNTSWLLAEGKAEIIDYQPAKVVVKTQMATPGILVSTDTYDFEWKALVEGEETKVFRADYDLRAVEVPAGEHEVKFVYDPLSFKIGLGISLLTALSLLIGVLLFRLKNLDSAGGLR